MKKIIVVVAAALMLTACQSDKDTKQNSEKTNESAKQTQGTVKSLRDFPLNFKVKSLSQQHVNGATTFKVKYEITDALAKYLAKEKPVISFRIELPQSLYSVIGMNTNDHPFELNTASNGKIEKSGTVEFSFPTQAQPDLSKKYVTNNAIKLHLLNENQREFFTIADLGSNAEKYEVNK